MGLAIRSVGVNRLTWFDDVSGDARFDVAFSSSFDLVSYRFYVVNQAGDGHCAGFKVKELKLNK